MNTCDVRYGFLYCCVWTFISFVRSFAARHTQKMMYLTSCLTHVYSLVGSSSVHKNPSLYEKKRGALSHIALEEARNLCIVCVHLRFFHPRRRRRFRRRYYYQHTTTPNNNNNNIKNRERGERKRVDKETFPPFFDLLLLPTQINKFAYSSSSYFQREIYLQDLLNILHPHSIHFFFARLYCPPFDHIP